MVHQSIQLNCFTSRIFNTTGFQGIKSNLSFIWYLFQLSKKFSCPRAHLSVRAMACNFSFLHWTIFLHRSMCCHTRTARRYLVLPSFRSDRAATRSSLSEQKNRWAEEFSEGCSVMLGIPSRQRIRVGSERYLVGRRAFYQRMRLPAAVPVHRKNLGIGFYRVWLGLTGLY